MYMTDDEICVRYRQARDKKAQIKILADLNATSKQEIISVLEDAGIPLPEKLKLDKPKPPRVFKFDENLARQFYVQGMMDKEIAEQLGVSKTTIFKWRTQNSLPAYNRKPSRAYHKPSEDMNLNEPIANYGATPHQNRGEAELNPVMLRIEKILNLIEPGDSPKVAGQYLDLMISMLMEEVERITTAENRKPLPGGQTGEQPR